MRGLILLVWIMTMATVALAETYEWTDNEGGVHFTDNLDKIPAKYKKKTRRIEVTPIIEKTEPSQPPSAASPLKSAAPLYGGHDEMWWRSNFGALREEMKSLQDGLPEKKEKFTAKHRKYIIYNKPSDRVAQNDIDQDIKNDEARIAEIRKQLDNLDNEAAKAGVPLEWRQ